MVHCEKFAKDLTLNLLYKLSKSIAIDKATFLGVMSMQIKIKRQPVASCKMFSQSFDPVDGRLKFHIRFNVESIEIFTMNVHPEVPMENSIDVDHWNYHEDKHRSQKLSSQVIFVEKKVDNSFHRVGSWSLPGMDPCRYQYNRFSKFQWSFFIRKHIFVKHLLLLLFFPIPTAVGNGKQMHISFLRRLDQNFLMKINFLIFLKHLQAGEIADILLILVRIAKSKLDRFILIEDILDGAFHLTILTQGQFAF